MEHRGHEELRTGRLILRRPMPDDADAILALHCDPLAVAHNPSDALSDLAEAQDLLGRWDEHWRRRGFGYWVLRYPDDELVLGVCGVKVVHLEGEPALNLLCRLVPAAWGRGLASEAASAVVAWAQAHKPEFRVIARVQPDNAASAHVAMRAGLIRAPHLDRDGEDGLDLLFISPAAAP